MDTRIQLTVQVADQIVMACTVNRPVWTIGREPDRDLVLPHAEVSRYHAEIRLVAQGAVLTDLDSSTGTVVDGVRLLPNQPHLLNSGAAIEIGPYTILFRQVSAKPKPAAEVEPTVQQQEILKIDGVWARRILPDKDPRDLFAPKDEVSAYLQYLPVVYYDTRGEREPAEVFFNRFLQIFEAIWEPLEQRQDHFPMYVDPRTCPSVFLPWFASWFELDVSSHLPEARLRSAITEAIGLYRWRGTKYGLARMIEVCTGLTPEITENPSEPFVFRIKVKLPEDGSTTLDELDKLIQTHKPAHSGYLLEAV